MANASAGSIFVDLLLRDAKFSEGAKRASKSLKDFGDQAEKAAKRAGQSIVAAATAIAALTGRQAYLIDETVKLSRSLGVVNENFQALTLLADEAGVSQQRLVNFITLSQKATVGAAQEIDKFANAFSFLGLEAKELINLSADQQFQKIAESLAEIENPTVRNATALQIFGKSGRDVINMLEDFKLNLDEAREFNDRFGLSVSAIDARKVEEANDQFGRLGKVIQGFGNIIAIQTAPLITALSKSLIESGIDGATAAKAIASAFEFVGDVIDIVRKGAIGLQSIFLKSAEGFAEFKTEVLEFRESILEAEDSFFQTPDSRKRLNEVRQALSDSKALAAGARDEFQKLTETAGSFETTIQKIAQIQKEAEERAKEREKNGLGSNAGAFTGELPKSGSGKTEAEKRLEELQRLYEQNARYLKGLDQETAKYNETLAELNELLANNMITNEEFRKALDTLNAEFGDNEDTVKDWSDQLTKYGERAAENIQDAFAEFLFDPFQDGVDGMLKSFVDVLRKMIAEQAAAAALGNFGGGGLLGAISGAFSQGGLARLLQTGNAGFIGPLPQFAEGGFLGPGEFGIAGEAGAELLYGGRSGVTVIPQDQMGGGKNTYYIDARGADQGAVARIEKSLLTLAGPGVIERRVVNAQNRGAL